MRGARKRQQTIDLAPNARKVTLGGVMCQASAVYASCGSLGGREVTGLTFGDLKECVVRVEVHAEPIMCAISLSKTCLIAHMISLSMDLCKFTC